MNNSFSIKTQKALDILAKLFRIDLTILKSTTYFKGKYNFQKTFKKANILDNQETYDQYGFRVEPVNNESLVNNTGTTNNNSKRCSVLLSNINNR